MPIRVLIADHRMDQLMLLAEFLLRRGVSAATCTDGKQAQEAIAGHVAAGEPYDLVIAYVDLPDVSGLRVLYDARSRHLETVAAVSCPHQRRDEKTETMIRKVGVSAVLDQPFDLMQVDRLVKKVLASRGHHSDRQPSPPAGLAEPSGASAVIYRDEQRDDDDDAVLPDIDDVRGPPRPSPTGTHQVAVPAADDDVALPAMGGSPPVARPASADPQQRAAAFYDPASGQLAPEAGHSGTVRRSDGPERVETGYRRQPSDPGTHQDTGYRRQASDILRAPAPGDGGGTGYTRRPSSEFFDPNHRPQAGTTRRLRRSLSGSFGPPPDQNVATTCVHCGQAMSVKATGKVMQVPCLACGKLNQVRT